MFFGGESMKHAWQIFIQDLRNIKRVPLIGFLLVGLAILPSLYAWFNLGAAWDPYANTKGIQVAVANYDQGTEIDGEYVNIGEELVEKLEGNDNLGWVFVSKEEAERGVELGDYYASIFLSERFTEELTNVLDGEPHQAEVQYIVNEKVNAIAPKMTSTGASTIVNQINDQIIEEITKVLFQEFDKLGIELEKDLPTFRRIKQTIYQLEERFPEINELGELIINIDDNWDKVEKNFDTILAIEESLPTIHDGLEQILRLEENFSQLYVLADGIKDLEAAIESLTKAIVEIKGMTQRFSDVEDYLEEMLDTIQQANEQINDMQNHLPSENDVNITFESFYDALDEANEAISESLAHFNHLIMISTKPLIVMIDSLENEEDVEKVEKLLADLDKELISQRQMSNQAIDMYTLLYEITGDTDILEVIELLDELNESIETMQSIVDHAQLRIEEEELPTSDEINRLRLQVEHMEQLISNGQHLLDGDWISNAMEQVDREISFEQMESLNEALTLASEMTSASEEKIEKMIERLPKVEQTINETVNSVEEKLPVVVERIETLNEFVQDVLPTIEEHVNDVAKWIRTELPTIEEKYLEFMDTLDEKLPLAKEAVNELATFSRDQLPETERLVNEMADRIRIIEENDYLDELIMLLRNDLDQESEFFASPVQLLEEKMFPIPNYGSANVPFYTTLCLWVGALLLSNLITTNLHKDDYQIEFHLEMFILGG